MARILAKTGNMDNQPGGRCHQGVPGDGMRVFGDGWGRQFPSLFPGPIVAVRSFNTTNGGFGIVSIDGDFTRATRLPAFTDADYAGGLCRSTDVGKRYICGYSAAPQSECVTIADDLTAGRIPSSLRQRGRSPRLHRQHGATSRDCIG